MLYSCTRMATVHGVKGYTVTATGGPHTVTALGRTPF